ncbi:MAG: cystathionine beta-lyase [Elsteraceae bacterium]
MDDQTRCIHPPAISTAGYASLSVGVERASTIVFPDGESYARRKERGPDGYSYGLAGTPTARTLEAQITALEGGYRTVLTPSGLSAVTTAMLAVLRPGDSVLIPDSVYPPVRNFATGFMANLGVTPVFYDPLLGAAITDLIDERTKLVWVESPGSTTMEVQDLPAIAAAARARGVTVGCDNSWATPLLFKPLANGADLSVEAITKYIGGHSDLLMGSITSRDAAVHDRIKKTIGHLGLGVSPDDCALALRGIQTLAVRLRQSSATALELAQWLVGRPSVERVLHPALPTCPGHAVWTRDFEGASGVFTVVFDRRCAARLYEAVSALSVFRIGASWGGAHSLVAPMTLSGARSATVWTGPDPMLRISVGLEATEALRADLEGMLATLDGKATEQVSLFQPAGG